MNLDGVWRSTLADRHRLLLVYLAGWPGLALVLALTWIDLADAGAPGDPSGHRLAKALSPLYLAQIPLMVWTAAFMYGRSSRQRLTETLPLSVRELNLSRILSAGMLWFAGAVAWFVAFAVYRLRGESFSPWLLLFGSLFFACYLFLSMRVVWVRAAPHVLIVALWISEILLDRSLQLSSIVWICVPLAPLAVAYAWRAVTLPPPRWAR